MHNKVLSVVGILSDEADPLVSVMKARASAVSRRRSLPRAGTLPPCLQASRECALLVRALG
jgi:hypothetical protein